MKQTIFFLAILTLIISSCTDDIDIHRHQKKAGLVVYAFPTNTDTFDIIVSAVFSLQSTHNELDIEEIHSNCNQNPDSIIYCARRNENNIPAISFKSVGQHKEGDTIRIEVKAKGFHEISSTTVIPERVCLENFSLDSTYYDGAIYAQYDLTFTDPPQKNYYALSAQSRYADYESAVEYVDIETGLDPILRATKLPGFNLSGTENSYEKMCIFNDRSFQDKTVCLHPCILSRYASEAFKVTLYTLTPEYYNMLKSLSSQTNNDLADYGLSFIYSTYSNIEHGYGCVAAYQKSTTPWMNFTKKAVEE